MRMPSSFDVMGLLRQHNTRWTLSKYREKQIVYAQGDAADSVCYIHKGRVKITVISQRGKEAIVAIRGPDEFCGEGALTGAPLRLATAIAMSTCEIIRYPGRPWSACFTRTRSLPTISSTTFWLEPPGLKRTWPTNCSIPARCGWRGLFCCWPTMAMISGRNRCP